MTQDLRMAFLRFLDQYLTMPIRRYLQRHHARGLTLFVSSLVAFALVLGFGFQQPAYATLNDDAYDGNIYALYGGNGSIVPPRMTIEQSLAIGRPAMVVYYIDDSADCKRFSPILNYTQGLYSKAISLIPVAVDSIMLNEAEPSPEAQLYRGTVPQTVLVNAAGEVVFDQEGLMPFETVDAELRKMLGLAPAPKDFKVRSTDRAINEINP
jgi:hypothetical protein